MMTTMMLICFLFFFAMFIFRSFIQMVLLWSIFGFLLVLVATAVRWRLVKQEGTEDEEEEEKVDEEENEDEEEEDKESLDNDDCEEKGNNDREWKYNLGMKKNEDGRQSLTASCRTEDCQGVAKKDTGVEKTKQDQLVPDTIQTRASTAVPTPRVFEASTSS